MRTEPGSYVIVYDRTRLDLILQGRLCFFLRSASKRPTSKANARGSSRNFADATADGPWAMVVDLRRSS